MTATTAVTMIKVWVKVGNNEPEKVEIRSDLDIDDLKSELFRSDKEEKRQYYGLFNNEKLSSSACVPRDTTGENPILFLKIDENYPESNNYDNNNTRLIATHIRSAPNNGPKIITSSTSLAENVNDSKLPTTTSTVTIPTINTTSNHLPPHLVEKIHYKNGDKYVGEINGKREPNGKGTMSWQNGRRYEGKWKNGKKDGQGTEYGANGAVNYIGEWKDDVLVSSHDEAEQR